MIEKKEFLISEMTAEEFAEECDLLANIYNNSISEMFESPVIFAVFSHVIAGNLKKCGLPLNTYMDLLIEEMKLF